MSVGQDSCDTRTSNDFADLCTAITMILWNACQISEYFNPMAHSAWSNTTTFGAIASSTNSRKGIVNFLRGLGNAQSEGSLVDCGHAKKPNQLQQISKVEESFKSTAMLKRLLNFWIEVPDPLESIADTQIWAHLKLDIGGW